TGPRIYLFEDVLVVQYVQYGRLFGDPAAAIPRRRPENARRVQSSGGTPRPSAAGNGAVPLVQLLGAEHQYPFQPLDRGRFHEDRHLVRSDADADLSAAHGLQSAAA